MAQLHSTVITLNISSTPGYLPNSFWSSGAIGAVVLSICFLLGFPGNIAVIILKPNWKNMSSLSQSLMLNLAVSDLLCMLTTPVLIYSFLNSWTLGLVSCKLIMYFVYCSIFSSLLTVTALSVQRYLQAVYLERRLHEVKAWKLLVPLWLVVIILSTPALVFQQPVERLHFLTCSSQYASKGQRMAVVLTETLVGTVSLCAIVFSYISLYRKVNQAPLFNNPRTTRLITSIIVTSVVLWIPYRTVTVLGVAAIYSNDENLQKTFEDSWRILGSVTFVNSAVNPLLYAFTSKRLGTWCQKIAQQLIQKFRIPQNLYSSRDVSAEVIFQS
ncbi:leukotriene B4 receptor 1-like [Oreochromis niloticus]|uniref:leukotriene B4 receptor 1-like n=1 Tax=Oreochromis niloticus TaxID=8128 RepID=UPI00022B0DC0|nr:leukotriene B4 receptor 1-like [Oreochromis niloticus]